MMVSGDPVVCQCDESIGEAKLIEWLLAGVLSVHLISLNLASAGPLLGIWVWGKDKSSLPARQATGLRLAWLAVGALLAGTSLGALQWLLLRQSGWAAAFSLLPERALWFALSELIFSLACLLGCAWCWRADRNGRWLHALLAVLSSSNLLYHFPPLMTVLSRLSSDPKWARVDVLDRATLLPLMKRPEVLALTVHFALASLAVAAVTVLWLRSRSRDLDLQDPAERSLVRGAAWWALAATAGQIPVGLWLIAVLPKAEMSTMMGESLVASLGLIVGLVLTLVLLQRLLTIAIGQVGQAELRSVVWIVVLLVLVMTITLKGDSRERVSYAGGDSATSAAGYASRSSTANPARLVLSESSTKTALGTFDPKAALFHFGNPHRGGVCAASPV